MVVCIEHTKSLSLPLHRYFIQWPPPPPQKVLITSMAMSNHSRHPHHHPASLRRRHHPRLRQLLPVEWLQDLVATRLKLYNLMGTYAEEQMLVQNVTCTIYIRSGRSLFFDRDPKAFLKLCSYCSTLCCNFGARSLKVKNQSRSKTKEERVNPGSRLDGDREALIQDAGGILRTMSEELELIMKEYSTSPDIFISKLPMHVDLKFLQQILAE